MPLRPSLDLPWADFIRQWCLEVDPGYSEAEIRQALVALEGHWPQRLDELEKQGARGISPMLSLVETGLVLAQCEGLDGFPSVIARACNGERSALSELFFAAHMNRLGLEPSLEPKLGDKKLDTLLSHGERNIYCEVIAPEVSDQNQEITAELAALAQAIVPQNKGADTEVLLSPEYEASRRDELLAFIKAAPIGVRLHEMPEVAKVIKFGDPVAVVAARLQAEGPAMVAAHTAVEAGQLTIAIVRAAANDLRARRLLEAERHHFSREERNVLAIDVSHIIAGERDWESPIRQCFKPSQNTRFGAVVLFTRGSLVVGGRKLHKRWKVLRNPHARVPLSDDLLKSIESLDDGPYQ